MLVAAEARAGHLDAARRTLKDFLDVVSKAKPVAQIKT